MTVAINNHEKSPFIYSFSTPLAPNNRTTIILIRSDAQTGEQIY